MRRILLSALIAIMLFVLPGYVMSQVKMKLTGTVSDSSKPLALVTVRIFNKKSMAVPLQTSLTNERVISNCRNLLQATMFFLSHIQVLPKGNSTL